MEKKNKPQRRMREKKPRMLDPMQERKQTRGRMFHEILKVEKALSESPVNWYSFHLAGRDGYLHLLR
jgi:hypothetical protein